MFKRFPFHTDPGHGWLEVDASDIFEVGLTASSFSEYSYSHAGLIYLEEDMDMMTFCRAYEHKHGHLPALDVVEHL